MRLFLFCSMLAGSWTIPVNAQPATPSKGAVNEITIPGSVYPEGRRGWAYTPANYPGVCRPACNLMVVFDGGFYVGIMALPGILDSLIAAGKTPPTVAILLDNGGPPARTADLANSARFDSFVANDLVPYVRKQYAVTTDAQRTVIGGVSLGGLAAAYSAFKHPSLFGNVLSQSGAYWRGNEASNDAPYEWLTMQLANSARTNVRFFLDVGANETYGALGGQAPSLIDANRRLRDVLTGKGYAVEYFEVPGGDHSPEAWRLRLPAGIVALSHPK